jgi:hypothetical protein
LEEFYGLGYKILSKNGYDENIEQGAKDRVNYVVSIKKEFRFPTFFFIYISS